MLLGQRVVVLGENSLVQGPRKVRDPVVVEGVEDPRVNASPVVNGHGSSSSASSVSANYIRPGTNRSPAPGYAGPPAGPPAGESRRNGATSFRSFFGPRGLVD